MRSLVQGLSEGPRVLRDATFHHLARVLRVRAGDTITLFDGRGREADARVVRLWEDELLVEVGVVRTVSRPSVALTLIIGLLKGERMDWVIQKATELGVARILPVATTNAVVKLEGTRAADRRERWGKIAAEAARQCGRADVPDVADIASFATVAATSQAGFRVLFHEVEPRIPLRTLLPNEPPTEWLAAVGPEGGFTVDEVSAARANGFAVAGLGPRILRAETAAIAALAVLGFAVGDL